MDRVIDISRRTRKREALHQTLLVTAQQLFAERGVAGTTVEDIAEAADVARGTVFNHFPYKEALAVEMAAQGIENNAHHAHALLESGTPALTVLRVVAHSVLELAAKYGEPAFVAAHELFHPDKERARWAGERMPLPHLFEAILIQGREEGAIRIDLPLSIVGQRLASIVMTTIAQGRGVALDVQRYDLDVCFDIIFNGITERTDQ